MLKGLGKTSSLSLMDSAVNLNAGNTLSVSNTAGQQIFLANGSLLHMNALLASGGIKAPQLTTHLVYSELPLKVA